MKGLDGSNPPLSASPSALFAFSAENSKIVRLFAKFVWFPTYGPGELPEPFDQIAQSWDSANKPTELSDFSVCTTWGIKGSSIYLLDVLRGRMPYPELKRAVRAQAEAHKATAVLIPSMIPTCRP